MINYFWLDASPQDEDNDRVPAVLPPENKPIIIGQLGFKFVPEGMIVVVVAPESQGGCQGLVRLW